MEDLNGRPPELYSRLKRYALRIIQLNNNALPRSGSGGVIGNRILRSGISPGAQYAGAQRAKSNKDFVGKIDKIDGACRNRKNLAIGWNCCAKPAQCPQARDATH